jgi:hypothetical protein
MIVDRRSTRWIAVCVVIVAASTAYYVHYAHRPGGPTGGSWPGIVYGAIGSAMIVFATLLSGRKKLRNWQLGRTYYWMQAHVWFGLLSYPIILFHAGFHWGGSLTQVLMWIFTIIIVSGIVGLIFQQILPKKMMRELPSETIYRQIDHLVEELHAEATELVRSTLPAPPADGRRPALPVATREPVAAAAPPALGVRPLADFYSSEVEPFLAVRIPHGTRLADERSSRMLFEELRGRIIPEFHEPVSCLEALVTERRQLAQQRRLHRLLHGWLLVHVPLSFMLLILGTVHAVMALRFTRIGM